MQLILIILILIVLILIFTNVYTFFYHTYEFKSEITNEIRKIGKFSDMPPYVYIESFAKEKMF